MRPRYTTYIAGLLAGALLFAACGDDDDTTADGGGVETTAAGSGAETTAAGGSTDAAATAAPAGDCTLAEPLKIGYLVDTGLGAIGDIPGNAGAKFETDQINAAGGTGGQQIEYEAKQVADDDAAAAQRATRELIDGGADIILGPPFSNFGLPMVEEANGELPILFVTSTELVLSDPERGAFLTSFNDNVQASAAAQFALEEGFTTAVTLSSTDIPYLNATTAAFTEVFEAGSGTVDADLSFSLGATDFSSQVNEIAAMDPHPDAIYSAFFLPEAGIFLEQLREAGVESAVISADGFDASLIWTIGEDAEGVFFTGHTFPSESNGVQAFLDAYEASGGTDIETVSFGVLGADAVQIAVAATEAACSTEGAALIAAISGLVNVPVTTGTVTYAGSGGTPQKDVAILTVTNGAPALVKSFYPTTIAG